MLVSREKPRNSSCNEFRVLKVKWKKLKERITTTDDETWSGWPTAFMSNEKVRKVDATLKDDLHITIREISGELNLSIGSIHRILHEDQAFKLSARLLTAEI